MYSPLVSFLLHCIIRIHSQQEKLLLDQRVQGTIPDPGCIFEDTEYVSEIVLVLHDVDVVNIWT